MTTRSRRISSWIVTAGSFLLAWAWDGAIRAAETPVPEDAVKAAYLYRFAGYVEWPESVPGRPFIIAVIGAPGVARELRRLVPDHPIHQQSAQIREVDRLEDLNGAQIVFVGGARLDMVRAIAARNRPTLIVTDSEQALEQGSMLNFVTIDNRIRFEVSLTAADRAGIRISSELLSVAIRVHGGRRQSDYLCIPSGLPELPEDAMGPCGMRQARQAPYAKPVRDLVCPSLGQYDAWCAAVARGPDFIAWMLTARHGRPPVS